MIAGTIAVLAGSLPAAAADNDRVPFSRWPQMQFKQARILFANTPRLASQGFAGARPEDFERTLIFFPVIGENVYFSNRDFGFGPVIRDIAIYYLDKDFNVLKKDAMKKLTGESYPPPGAAMSMEGLPDELRSADFGLRNDQGKQTKKGLMKMIRGVETKEAPKAIGPYSQAIIAGDLVYTSGQIALNPATGTLVEGDIAAQTEQVISNLAAVLRAAGAALENVLKTTVYLTDMTAFPQMNAVYEKYFAHKPARSTVGVAALPKGALVEIECIALIP